MAGAVSQIANVSVGDSITANLQNHIINAVNSMSPTPLTPKKNGDLSFPIGPQGIVLPAVLDSTAPVTYYNPGDVVVVTGYLDSQDNRNVASGVDRNFGVTVSTKSDTLPVGGSIAVVVRAVEATGSGSVCVSGACLAKVARIASSPAIGDGMVQVTGSLLTGNTFFSIGHGVGDVDLLWEESLSNDTHFAYVTLPGSNKKGVPAYNASGVEIPPNSALEVVTGGTDGRLDMQQPSEDNLFQVYYSPAFPIPASTPFEALTPEDGLVATTDAPTIGDEVGTAENSWSMKKGNTGFKVRGLVGDLAYASPFRVAASRTDYIIPYAYDSVSGGGATLSYGHNNQNPVMTSTWRTLTTDGTTPITEIRSLGKFYATWEYVSAAFYLDNDKYPGVLAFNYLYWGIQFATSAEVLTVTAIPTIATGLSYVGSENLSFSGDPLTTISWYKGKNRSTGEAIGLTDDCIKVRFFLQGYVRTPPEVGGAFVDDYLLSSSFIETGVFSGGSIDWFANLTIG